MVMGYPYDYERVLQDSAKYEKKSEDGRFPAWWEYYLKDEGFKIEYRPLAELRTLPEGTSGMFVFSKPLDNAGHVVAVDRHGVIDPLGKPAHCESLQSFWEIFQLEGWQLYHGSFLAVKRAVAP
jgi:hypothetical protein